jgi:hypothetical protein
MARFYKGIEIKDASADSDTNFDMQTIENLLKQLSDG